MLIIDSSVVPSTSTTYSHFYRPNAINERLDIGVAEQSSPTMTEIFSLEMMITTSIIPPYVAKFSSS
jgi:hypothetical protein